MRFQRQAPNQPTRGGSFSWRRRVRTRCLRTATTPMMFMTSLGFIHRWQMATSVTFSRTSVCRSAESSSGRLAKALSVLARIMVAALTCRPTSWKGRLSRSRSTSRQLKSIVSSVSRYSVSVKEASLRQYLRCMVWQNSVMDGTRAKTVSRNSTSTGSGSTSQQLVRRRDGAR